MRCEELSDFQFSKLVNVVDEYLHSEYMATCLNSQVFEYLENSNMKFCFKMGTPGGTPGAYSSSSLTIYFNTTSNIREDVFGEEFFHAYQDAFYGGLPTNFGRSNIEFEAKLYHDISHNGVCCIAFQNGAVQTEYFLWLKGRTNDFTEVPSWSDISDKYYYFLEKFTEIKPEYDFPINYNQKPDAIFNLSNCQ